MTPGPESPSCRLEAVDLTCERGDRRLFAGLGFALNPGEALIVEGANGAGKTTLLRTLCGLSRPVAGSVRWCGEDIHAIRPEFNAALNYVGHQPGIKADLTPLENLRVDLALHGLARGDLMDILDRVGLYGFEDVPCRTLSAGQRRRVALARLLAVPARLWILDEPFTAIDRDGVGMLCEAIDAHLAAGGLAVLTSHQAVELAHGQVSRLTLGRAA